ncbi:MAG TPA: hypothetical protein VGF75_08280 [Candidatus Saccharimonadales bacterium]|jgi:hypothetical protein
MDKTTDIAKEQEPERSLSSRLHQVLFKHMVSHAKAPRLSNVTVMTNKELAARAAKLEKVI